MLSKYNILVLGNILGELLSSSLLFLLFLLLSLTDFTLFCRFLFAFNWRLAAASVLYMPFHNLPLHMPLHYFAVTYAVTLFCPYICRTWWVSSLYVERVVSRRMEFAADFHAAQICGTDAIATFFQGWQNYDNYGTNNRSVMY